MQNVDETLNPQQNPTAPPAWKPFPADALPSAARAVVYEGARALGCDPAFVALPMLAGMAGAIGATHAIELKPGWTEPAVLWCAVVAESGAMKSPAQSLALDPLRKLQAWAMQDYPARLKEHEQQRAIFEADLMAWKRSGRRNGEPPPEKPDEPTAQRYLVDDITIEALADRLRDAPRGLLAGIDELDAWLGSFNSYRPGGRGGDVARWLSIHRASGLLIDRKAGTAKTVHVPWAAVSLAGGIQPATLRRALGVEHFDDGLAARLLLAAPPRQKKQWTEDTVSQQTLRRAEVLFGRLTGLEFGTDQQGNPTPVVLPLTPEGKSAWIEFYNEHAAELATAKGDRAAVLSKMEGVAARLALVVQLAECVSDETDPAAVDETSVRAGVTLARWFAQEAKRVYVMLAGADEDREARRLQGLIQEKGGRITTRELMRTGRQYRGSADEANAALDQLAERGVGRWAIDAPNSKGGRPTPVFELLTHPPGNGVAR